MDCKTCIAPWAHVALVPQVKFELLEGVCNKTPVGQDISLYCVQRDSLWVTSSSYPGSFSGYARGKRKWAWVTRLGNKMLDRFSTIQYMTISFLRHANIILRFCNQIGALKVESGFVPSDKNVTQNTTPSLYTYIKVARDYFGSTLQLIALCIIQFSRSQFLWKWSICMLDFSILVKMLHNSFGHNTDYACDFVCMVFCFAACLPATVLHDVLKAKFLV